MCRSPHASPRPLNYPLAFLSLLLMTVAAAADQPGKPVWDAKAATHLLSRTSFVASPEEVARLAALPLDRAVQQLIDEAAAAQPPKRPSWVRDQWINGGRRWSDMSAEEYLIVLRRNSARNRAELADLKAWWLQQMIDTKTPLREQMTLFWHGHFTSATSKALSLSQGFYQQNETWRKYALGNFRDFVKAVTLDPAMMAYLDLERSNKTHPNENYARELMELFTLGVGNYTEKDVLEVARALTGWTLDAPPGTVIVKRPTAPDRLVFASITREGLVPTFVPKWHDEGEKTILGKTGRFGLKEVLDVIVSHPACGRLLAGKLIAYFGAYDPEGKLRERMTEAFRSSKYEIRPMLEVLFTAPEFYALETRGNQIKSPVRLLVGACRDLRLEGKATPTLAHFTTPLGQELFNPPTVKGWPSGESWITASTLALRCRLGEMLLDGKEITGTEPLGRQRLMALSQDPKQAAATTKRLMEIDAERAEMENKDGIQMRFNPSRLMTAKAPDTPEKLVDALLERMIVTKVRPLTRTALIDTCAAVPAADRPTLAVRLILASPEYQLE
ncbi:MAG TPA: DUF1800 domain-containing protein [Gemmataceae bacterium]|nr:DUF1800 domain-containing protein [Gemmataceae bacterium]